MATSGILVRSVSASPPFPRAVPGPRCTAGGLRGLLLYPRGSPPATSARFVTQRRSFGVSVASDPGRAATDRPAQRSPLSAPYGQQPTGRAPHRRPLPAPPGSARNVGDPAPPRSDHGPGQSAVRRREAPPPPPLGLVPAGGGAGRGGGPRRTEGRRHLGGGDVSRALCSGPGSCRRVGRGGGRGESGDLATGRVPGGGTATCGARRPSASGKPAAGGSFCDPRPRSWGSLGSGGSAASGWQEGLVWVLGSLTRTPHSTELQSGKCARTPPPETPVREVCPQLTPRLPSTDSSQGSVLPALTRLPLHATVFSQGNVLPVHTRSLPPTPLQTPVREVCSQLTSRLPSTACSQGSVLPAHTPLPLTHPQSPARVV